MIVRIYTGDDGQSHFEEVDMDSGPHPWGELREATGVIFNRSQVGSFSDWHNAPRRQFVITLSGAVLLADDLTGQGHTTRTVGHEPRLSVSVPIP